MKATFKLFLLSGVWSITTIIFAQPSQVFFESFTDTQYPEVWVLGNESVGEMSNGHFVCNAMTQQPNGKYRADLKYNNTNNNPISEDHYFVLDPEKHHYMAVKFIGERPNGALKMEMKNGEDKWFNSAWNGGRPASTSTEMGNYIYYFDLTADASYMAGGNIVIKLFNLIIADAETEPYNYSIDWIGIFESLEAIEEFKAAKDDGENDKDEEVEIANGLFESFSSPEILNSIWITANNSISSIADGHLICKMADQGSSYRGDIRYNNPGNNVAINQSNYFTLIPGKNNYLAIKFIGQRPHGALKLEMRYLSDDPDDNGWLNSKWNGGNPSSLITEAGNYIYYFDLSADDKYTNADILTIDIFNITVADAKEEPYNYIIDWIGIFESLEAIDEFKDIKDDGEEDKDEEITGVIINEKVISINSLSAGELNNADHLVLSGSWQENHFSLLATALDNNEVITYIDLSSQTIPAYDFLSGVNNPNCLIFVSPSAFYPENWKNVIVDDWSESILLEDGYPYYSPKTFTTLTISYTRNYTIKGWASLCLPFDIEIRELPQGITVYEFINAEGTAITFSKVESDMLIANTPYIADISEIDAPKVFKVNQTGDITIPFTNSVEVSQGDYIFKGSFREIRPAEGLYLLGSDGEGFGVGTVNSYIPPFRSYIANVNTDNSDVRYLSLGFGEEGITSINVSEQEENLIIRILQNSLMINSDKMQSIRIYSIDGRLVQEIQLQTGENSINGLPKGMYLVNNQKIVIN